MYAMLINFLCVRYLLVNIWYIWYKISSPILPSLSRASLQANNGPVCKGWIVWSGCQSLANSNGKSLRIKNSSRPSFQEFPDRERQLLRNALQLVISSENSQGPSLAEKYKCVEITRLLCNVTNITLKTYHLYNAVEIILLRWRLIMESLTANVCHSKVCNEFLPVTDLPLPTVHHRHETVLGYMLLGFQASTFSTQSRLHPLLDVRRYLNVLSIAFLSYNTLILKLVFVDKISNN